LSYPSTDVYFYSLCVYLSIPRLPSSLSFFLFNDTAPTAIYTLSLHDALPICRVRCRKFQATVVFDRLRKSDLLLHSCGFDTSTTDRKSTRLNSSHVKISYAVFCLKKKKKKKKHK